MSIYDVGVMANDKFSTYSDDTAVRQSDMWKGRRDAPKARGGYELTVGDLRYLWKPLHVMEGRSRTPRWVGDSVMGAYIDLVNQRLRAAGNQEVFVLSTDLIQKLKDRGGGKKYANRGKDPESRRSWEKSSLHAGTRTLIEDEVFGQAPDWTSKKRLLIPVNKPGVHWGLLDVRVPASSGGEGDVTTAATAIFWDGRVGTFIKLGDVKNAVAALNTAFKIAAGDGGAMAGQPLIKVAALKQSDLKPLPATQTDKWSCGLQLLYAAETIAACGGEPRRLRSVHNFQARVLRSLMVAQLPPWAHG
jgi:hypothetical protein